MENRDWCSWHRRSKGRFNFNSLSLLYGMLQSCCKGKAIPGRRFSSAAMIRRESVPRDRKALSLAGNSMSSGLAAADEHYRPLLRPLFARRGMIWQLIPDSAHGRRDGWHDVLSGWYTRFALRQFADGRAVQSGTDQPDFQQPRSIEVAGSWASFTADKVTVIFNSTRENRRAG